MIDTHAHLNSSEFDQDRGEVISFCRDLDIEIINVGVDYESSLQAIEMAKNGGLYASIGLHPTSRPEPLDNFQDLFNQRKVVAIGETGLDFMQCLNNENEKKRQQDLFNQHGQWAKEYALPMIMHCRQAYRELISMLRKEMLGIPGVIHSFSGTLADARELINLDYYLGFNGLIFKMELDEVIKSTPLDRILIETDSPYLTPPSLGRKRNAPHLGLRIVLEKIAYIKKIPAQEVADITKKNAYKLFQLEKHGGISAS